MDEEDDMTGWYNPPDNEAGGLAPMEGAADSGDISKTRLAKNASLQARIRAQHALANDAISQGMGANASQRWSGTPAIGLAMFKRRDPIFAVSGVDRNGDPRVRRRIDASTHMATPPSGLIGGKALENASRGIYGKGGRPTAFTPKQEWDGMFEPALAVSNQTMTKASESGAGRFAGIRGTRKPALPVRPAPRNPDDEVWAAGEGFRSVTSKYGTGTATF